MTAIKLIAIAITGLNVQYGTLTHDIYRLGAVPYPQETNKYGIRKWSNLHKIKHTIRWNHENTGIPKIGISPITSASTIINKNIISLRVYSCHDHKTLFLAYGSIQNGPLVLLPPCPPGT